MMNLIKTAGCLIAIATVVTGCDSSSGEQQLATQKVDNVKPVEFMVNQVGFTSNQAKFVVLSDTQSDEFTLLDLATDQIVMTGRIELAKVWQPAGAELYRSIDLSALQRQGRYKLNLSNSLDSYEFEVEDQLYLPIHKAALKSFYFNRASTAITPEYSNLFARPLGHADEEVKVHQSAASPSRPVGTTLASSKGWYDAGDFGKYVVNSGIATYTLLLSYDQNKAFYRGNSSDIPESNNAVPDILDEIKWNLDWLATMQDEDGGVYHKLTTLEWPGIEMPDADKRDRYVIGKSTSATLNFAAVMAYASRVYGSEVTADKNSEKWLEGAKSAWQWAQENPNRIYQQPEDVKSGEYGDSNLSDEFLWAAVELYLATLDPQYLANFDIAEVDLISPSWQHVSVLPLISLSNYQSADTELAAKAVARLIELADRYVEQYQESVFKVAMTESDFVWGSNSVALNQAMVLAQAFKATGDDKYRAAAESSIDYVLGQNPLAFSFVTGTGEGSAKFPHHRASAADNIDEPIPGMIVGGPQPGKQDGCNYLYSDPARTYVDDWCSYATNEVAINWNAPLVYVLAFKLNLP